MDIIALSGLLGVSVVTVVTGASKYIFSKNIEFHKILNSFPLISNDRLNKVITTSGVINTNVSIPKDFTDFVELKKVEPDEFLAKLENFDSSKLKFKKKVIISFINNLKRLLISKASEIEIHSVVNIKTGEITNTYKSKPIEWTAYNYYNAFKIINESKNELYLFKIFGF
jgi:hypothetical protein